MKIMKIDVDGMRYPYGIDNPSPVFHFVAQDARNNAGISFLQLQLLSGGTQVWDTGKLPYAGSNDILYRGGLLNPKTVYQVILTLWDNQNETDRCETSFETGFLGSDWQADWIEPEQEPAEEEKVLPFLDLLIPNPQFWGGETRLKPVKKLRTEYTLNKPAAKARLYASAHGIYQCYLNGRKISDRRLAPENSAYHKILYYQTYDVTEDLVTGKNCLGFLLGDGWWIGRLGLSGESCNYGNRLAVIYQLEITYADGSSEIFCSQEDVKSADSHILYSDLYIGEKQDQNRDQCDWMQPGYQDTDWSGCSLAEENKSNLTGQMLDPVRVVEEIEPLLIFRSPANELIIDFGQVISGVVHLEIEGSAQSEVTFEHGEVLSKEGNFIHNILGRNKDQKDVFLCREGKQVLEPQFTYHGFRYVRISGLEESRISMAKALVLATELEKTGSFHCSDERLNQLQHNIEWSTIGNMCSIPTDCPQREKLGWTGDIQVYTRTGCFNYDLRAFLGAWMKNLRAEQCESGEVPVVVPNPRHQEQVQRIMSGGQNSSAGWGDACVLVPYYLYQSYGNLQILAENFASMEQWLGYVRENCRLKPEGYNQFTQEQKDRNEYLWTKQYHFGDWLIPSLRAMPDGIARGTAETADVVGSCFYAITVDCFAKICRILGQEEKAAEYEQLLSHIRRAIRDEFVREDGSVKGSDLQGLYVILLRSGAVDGELERLVLAHLVRLIRENGYCLDTGFASVSYLLDELYDRGEKETAYRILFQTKAPSWLYMVQNGATTMWENWMAVLEDGTPTESSYNHYAFGCVGDWIYRRIGGIQAVEPGYRQILIAPDTECGLTESSCSIQTPYGLCACSWKRQDSRVIVEGQVPVGPSATLRIGGKEIKLTSGKFSEILNF